MPIPSDVSGPPTAHPTLGKPATVWCYRDAAGGRDAACGVLGYSPAPIAAVNGDVCAIPAASSRRLEDRAYSDCGGGWFLRRGGMRSVRPARATISRPRLSPPPTPFFEAAPGRGSRLQCPVGPRGEVFAALHSASPPRMSPGIRSPASLERRKAGRTARCRPPRCRSKPE